MVDHFGLPKSNICPNCSNPSKKCKIIEGYPFAVGAYIIIYRCNKCQTFFYELD